MDPRVQPRIGTLPYEETPCSTLDNYACCIYLEFDNTSNLLRNVCSMYEYQVNISEDLIGFDKIPFYLVWSLTETPYVLS